jgi:hypothetical protein
VDLRESRLTRRARNLTARLGKYSTRDFRDPKLFALERCTDDPKYAGDECNALQPCSFGPRAFFVKNLAHAKV